MSREITIGGREVTLAWTQDVSRRMAFRVSKIGGAPSIRAMTQPKTASHAIVTWLWLLLPSAVHIDFPMPEDLFLVIDLDTESEAIGQAVAAVISEMHGDAEKKSSGRNTPSPASNSGSPVTSGTDSTPAKPTPSRKHGGEGKRGKRSG